jgi:VanZ family protein
MSKTAKYLATNYNNLSEPGGIDPEFFDQVAQIAHFGAWFFLMIFCATFSNHVLQHRWAGVILAVCTNIPYAVWHEFFWDPVHENAATRGSDFEDFCFLLLGGLAGFLVYKFLIL